ncbi:MAG: hypothetical protein U1G07_02495 [Verrucomicrobiota bacterium]
MNPLHLLLLCTAFLVWPAQAAAPEPEPESPAAPVTPSIDGTWRWTFTMPDGTTSQPKLVLETEEGRLTGSTSFRPGTEIGITNVTLAANRLRFQVIRRRGEREIITTYSGLWSGKVIRGKIESNWAGETRSYDWEATRAHEGAEGVWKWTTTFRGRRYEARVKLEQDGEVLTGVVPGSGRGGRRLHISNGSVKNGDVYFEIERGTGDAKVLVIYQGKQTGDTIKGTIETHAGDRKAEAPWTARRAD